MLAGESHANQRGFHFRRRAKRAGRNAQRDFGPGVKLAERGKIAVVAHVGTRHDAFGDFELDDDVDRSDLTGPAEEVMEDGRRDVVRQIPVDVEFSGGEIAESGARTSPETISRPGHFSGAVSRAALQTFGKPLIGFDGDDAAASPTRSCVISPWPGPISIQVRLGRAAAWRGCVCAIRSLEEMLTQRWRDMGQRV